MAEISEKSKTESGFYRVFLRNREACRICGESPALFFGKERGFEAVLEPPVHGEQLLLLLGSQDFHGDALFRPG